MLRDMQGKKWKDLTAGQRRVIVGIGSLQILLLVSALRDLRRRPADQVRGSKRMWPPLMFVNFIGPITWKNAVGLSTVNIL